MLSHYVKYYNNTKYPECFGGRNENLCFLSLRTCVDVSKQRERGFLNGPVPTLNSKEWTAVILVEHSGRGFPRHWRVHLHLSLSCSGGWGHRRYMWKDAEKSVGLMTSLDNINCHIIDKNCLFDECDQIKNVWLMWCQETGRKIRHLL